MQRCAASALPLSYDNLDNHQPPSILVICTAQVGLKCQNVAHLAATQYSAVRTPLGVTPPENSHPVRNRTHAEFLHGESLCLALERYFRSTPNGVLTAHTEWLPDCVELIASFSPTCALYI